MKVLHVHSGNIFGGVETVLVNLLRHRSPDVVYEFALCYQGRLEQELLQGGAAVHSLGIARLSRPWSVVQAQRQLARLLQSNRYDIAICHSGWSQTIFGRTLRQHEVPLLRFVHGSMQSPELVDHMAASVTPNFVLCTSDFVRRTLPATFAALPQDTVYCPVPTLQPRRSRAQVRNQLSTSAEDVVIAMIARLDPWKGHEVLLHSLALLPPVGWTAWIVGDGHDRRFVMHLHDLTLQLGIADRVRFTGQRTDIPDLLFASDIFCQPNTEPEPLGISLIEAMHAALPIVTSGTGGAVETASGIAMFAEPNDVTTVAFHLRSLLENRELRVSLGSRGPARATELCDPHTQTLRFERALASFLQQRAEQMDREQAEVC